MLSAGIDVGFENTKAVILRDGRVLAHAVAANGTQALGAVITRVLEQAAAQAGVPLESLERILATGDGREYATQAHGLAPEAQCCARGAASLLPTARTVLDMGAETGMAIRVGQGRPLNIVRNDRCASGTGRGLRAAAKILGRSLDEMSALSLRSTEEISIDSTCAVFAESEIISKIHGKHRVEDISRAVFRGLARRAHSLIVKVGQEPEVAMVGGVAQSLGMIRALEEELACRLLVPEEPLIVGALGAALLAGEDTA